MGEVVVTGSRISRRDYVADSPIVSVGPKAIEATGDVTLERVINNLPQIVPNLGASNNNPGNGQFNIALRGLGTTRTLVLVDGRRVTPSNSDGTVDVNTIPQALIENIEIITGGASAVYGSDAVAGVVNFKLRHNFQGVVIDSQYNISDQGDGEETAVSITLGGNFAEDRGNATISMAYDNRDAIYYGDRSDVTVNGFPGAGLNRILAVSGASTTIPQGAYTFTSTNLPSQAAVNSVFGRYGVAAGAVTNNSNLGFNSDGTLFKNGFNYKGPTTIDFSTIPLTTGGAGPGSYNTGALNYVLTPQTRYQAFATGEYAITPHIKAYSQFSFTDLEAVTRLAPSPAAGNPGTALTARPGTGQTGFLVPVTNPFIPADLRAILASRADPTAPFIFNKRFSELGFRNADFQNRTWQLLAGVRGDVPGMDINYDVFTSYGRTESLAIQTGNVQHSAVRQLLESPTGSAGSCSGYNIFGQNGISSACAAFISPTTKNVLNYTQRQVEADVNGHLFTMPSFGEGFGGGDVRFAFGADYRSDRAVTIPDAIAASIDQSGTVGSTTTPYNNAPGIVGFNAAAPTAGTTDVYEVYGELLVPILKDVPFAKSLNLDLGARFSDYNTIGNTFTYKAEMDWRVFDWLLLRGGFNRAIRAPNIGDLYAPLNQNFPTIGAAGSTVVTGDPCDINSAYRKGNLGLSAAGVRALCVAQGIPTSIVDTYTQINTQSQSTTGGNPNLAEERANTYTGGVVLQPHFSNPLFARLSASIDYYNINIKGTIGSVSLSTELQSCFNANGLNPTYAANNFFCQQFNRDPATGNIGTGLSTNQNLGGLRTSGVDFQVDWGFALAALPYLGLSENLGNLNFNFLANWLNDYDVQVLPGTTFQQNRGYIGNFSALPVWKGLLNASYSVGPIEVGVTERYIADMKDASCVALFSGPCTARGVPATFYTDLTGRWKINDTLELRGGIQNVTNQEPRFFTSGSASQGNTDASTYDLIGRRYYVAVKARF